MLESLFMIFVASVLLKRFTWTQYSINSYDMFAHLSRRFGFFSFRQTLCSWVASSTASNNSRALANAALMWTAYLLQAEEVHNETFNPIYMCLHARNHQHVSEWKLTEKRHINEMHTHCHFACDDDDCALNGTHALALEKHAHSRIVVAIIVLNGLWIEMGGVIFGIFVSILHFCADFVVHSWRNWLRTVWGSLFSFTDLLWRWSMFSPFVLLQLWNGEEILSIFLKRSKKTRCFLMNVD